LTIRPLLWPLEPEVAVGVADAASVGAALGVNVGPTLGGAVFWDAVAVAVVVGLLWPVVAGVGRAAVWGALADTGGLVGDAFGVVLMQPTTAMAATTARMDLVSGISATSAHLGALLPIGAVLPAWNSRLATDARSVDGRGRTYGQCRQI
jgi:hypothetical protein